MTQDGQERRGLRPKLTSWLFCGHLPNFGDKWILLHPQRESRLETPGELPEVTREFPGLLGFELGRQFLTKLL